MYISRPTSWRKNGEDRSRTFWTNWTRSSTNRKKLWQSGSPEVIKDSAIRQRQNFLYFLCRNHICISRVILELRRKNEIAQNNKKLSYRRGTGRAMRCVSWNLANCHATVQELLVRQDLNKSMLWSWRVTVGQCVINMCTQSWRDRVESLSLPYRCHKQTDYGTELWISLA